MFLHVLAHWRLQVDAQRRAISLKLRAKVALVAYIFPLVGLDRVLT